MADFSENHGQPKRRIRVSAAILSIGGLRLFQDADSPADDQGAHRGADDEVGPGRAGGHDQEAGDHHADVDLDIRGGKDPARAHVNLAVAVLAEEEDAGGVGDESQSRDQNHQQGHGLAATYRTARNLVGKFAFLKPGMHGASKDVVSDKVLFEILLVLFAGTFNLVAVRGVEGDSPGFCGPKARAIDPRPKAPVDALQ